MGPQDNWLQILAIARENIAANANLRFLLCVVPGLVMWLLLLMRERSRLRCKRKKRKNLSKPFEKSNFPEGLDFVACFPDYPHGEKTS